MPFVLAWNCLHSQGGLLTKGNLDERYGKWYFIHGTVLLFQKTEEERRNKKNLWMTVAALYGL